MDPLRSASPAGASSPVDTLAELLEDIAAAEQEIERGEVIEHDAAKAQLLERFGQ
ncbi:MAG TPA: hypothetical protein VE913_23380 [Longimicrobium sp.]|nr:hypothetical protein [Longimicrobium sp.]